MLSLRHEPLDQKSASVSPLWDQTLFWVSCMSATQKQPSPRCWSVMNAKIRSQTYWFNFGNCCSGPRPCAKARLAALPTYCGASLSRPHSKRHKRTARVQHMEGHRRVMAAVDAAVSPWPLASLTPEVRANNMNDVHAHIDISTRHHSLEREPGQP